MRVFSAVAINGFTQDGVASCCAAVTCDQRGTVCTPPTVETAESVSSAHSEPVTYVSGALAPIGMSQTAPLISNISAIAESIAKVIAVGKPWVNP